MNFIKRRMSIALEYFMRRKMYSGYIGLKEIINMIFEMPLNTRVKNFVDKIIKGAHGGHTIVYVRGISRPLYWPSGFPEDMLKQFVMEVFNGKDWHYYDFPGTEVKRGDVVADCGASEGLFALKHMDKAKHIYCIEPMDVFVKALDKTFREKNNVSIIKCALSEDKNDDVLMDANGLFGKQPASAEKVPVRTLDSLFYEKGVRLDYIKADVEGSEFKLLLGSKNVIKEYKPRMAVAVYHDGNNWSEMVSFVKDIAPGYKYKIKGMYYENKKPVMLHMWHE